MLKFFFWHFKVYFPRCLCPHPEILNYHFFLYFKNLIWLLLLDVTCQSEPLRSSGRRKESAEGEEEENICEARMGCKSRWVNKPVRLLWGNRCDDVAPVTRDSALKVIGWNGFLGESYPRSWNDTSQGRNLFLFWRGNLKKVGSMFLRSSTF